MVRRGSAVLIAVVALLAPAAYARPHPAYRIPPGNPFAATPGARAEIYVYGMRNPYRWSFDSATGDMYVGDVGGNQREEIDYLALSRIAGANLGWRCVEGTLVQTGCRPRRYLAPAFEYPSGPDVVIGGFVVHAPDLPSFAGRYLYGRYETGLWILGARAAAPTVQLSAAVTGITSLGQDGAGHVYATAYDGPLYRLGENAGALTITKAGDFDRPVDAVPVPGNPGALFVVEKRGTVKLLSGGIASTVLDISDRVRDDGYEQGLLGFVAAPDYAQSGRTFAFYTDNAGDIEVDAYRHGARSPVLTIPHRDSNSHHGGQLNIGADGYLYLSTGDGDPYVDAHNDAQRLDSLLGKILRIDVSASSVDRRVPRLSADVTPEQRSLRLGGAVAYVRCSERCSVFARAGLRVAGRSYALGPVGLALRARQRARMKLALTPSARRALKRGLGHKLPAALHLRLYAEDPTGNRSAGASATTHVMR